LRSQLAGLRRGRIRLRAVAAWSALGICLLSLLGLFFALDLIFALGITERCVVLLLALAAAIWAFRRFSLPLLRTREDEIEMALLVQRDQRIDSDLVAALQFEAPGAERHGSSQLQTAVIEYVAATGHGIELLDADLRRKTFRRLTLLSLLLSSAAMIAILSPGHASALLRRLALQEAHYPTRTTIEQVFVNHTLLLDRDTDGSRPRPSNGAEGRPLHFLVQCSGELPSQGTCQLLLLGESNRRSRLKLAALSLDERKSRLQSALQQLTGAIQQGLRQLPPPQFEEIKSLLAADAPAAAIAESLPAAAEAVSRTLETWPASASKTALLAGRLEQLHSSLEFKLTAGDAWTEPATIRMIPLPIVELQAEAVPPAYAAGQVEPQPASRQFALLEGSALRLAIRGMNEKRLQSAWIVLQGKRGLQKYDLQQGPASALVWSLPEKFPPLENIREELRFEIQVIDTDGLSLESPIRGTVRIRPDRPPAAVAGTIHKLVLPSGAPLIHYRATDDFGISRITLVVDLERAQDNARPAASAASAQAGSTAASAAPAAASAPAAPSRRYELLTAAAPVTKNQLPIIGKFPLPLADLPLSKGDRLKLTLEVTDYRGQNEQGTVPGVAFQADPLVLEVSDESGVLAAIAEADPASAERLSDLISRELNIGDVP
jgi:hypothetical protein